MWYYAGTRYPNPKATVKVAHWLWLPTSSRYYDVQGRRVDPWKGQRK